MLKYEFERVRYDVTISRIFVFPQCYAAIAPWLGNMKDDYLIVDIGSKTTNVVYLKSGISVESRSVTIEKVVTPEMVEILKDNTAYENFRYNGTVK